MTHPQQIRFAVFVLLILMSSCAPKRAEIALDIKTIGAPALIALVEAGENKVKSLEGSGTVSFESPEIAGSAAFELSLKKPDSLLVLFEGPFGIDIGTLFLSREKYVVYNSFENRVITGSPSSNSIRSVIPFDLTYDQILNAFSGIFSIPSDQKTLRRYAIDDERFFLSFNCGTQLCNYWIDNQYLLATKFEMIDEQNRVVMQALSSSLTEEDGASAPRRIVVRFPQEGRQISIYYSSLALNPAHPSFAYSIPANADTIVQ